MLADWADAPGTEVRTEVEVEEWAEKVKGRDGVDRVEKAFLDVRLEILNAPGPNVHYFDPTVYNPFADTRPSAAGAELRKRTRYPVRWPDGSVRVNGELHPLAISSLGGLSATGALSLRRVGKLIRRPAAGLIQSLGFWAVLASARALLTAHGMSSATKAHLL